MMIVQALSKLQKDKGYLPRKDLEELADRLGVPLHRIQEVISFFPHYRTDPPPKVEIHVCRDMACRLRNFKGIGNALRSFAREQREGEVEIHEVSCLGRCDRAPALMINEDLFVERTADELIWAAQGMLDGNPVQPDTDRSITNRNRSTWQIDCYSERPNYDAIRAYVRSGKPDEVVEAIKLAGLLGMGGAGGDTSIKWNDVRRAKGTRKYVVCNGDESEPGTFKDRDLLLSSPHLIIEGMILAGLVVGADQGYVYIRHEYHEQIEAMEKAIEQAEKMGACGSNIFGSGSRFFLEVFISPGGYICGEQTALIEAMEDKRAEPRNRPPELQTNGLFDKPTLLNNVETFAWVPSIMLKRPSEEMLSEERKEAEKSAKREAAPAEIAPASRPDANVPGLWYKRSGEKDTKGRRFFSVSGDVKKPGAVEVPCGITLGDLIDQYCGGMRSDTTLQAVALSGPSGGFLPAKIPVRALRADGLTKFGISSESEIDIRKLPMDVWASRAIGYMLGGGIVVYSDKADMLDQAVACSRFYQSESCGKCVPCRIGSRKILDMGIRLQKGNCSEGDIQVLSRLAEELGRTMDATSICGLGQVASKPLRSLFMFFRDSIDTRPFLADPGEVSP